MSEIKFTEFVRLLDCDNPSQLWFYDTCDIDDAGIKPKKLEEHIEHLLIGDEWIVRKQMEEDIKLNFPCKIPEFNDWCLRNQANEFQVNPNDNSYFISGSIRRRTCELHQLIWKIHQVLTNNGTKRVCAANIWNEIKNRSKQYDTDGIIISIDSNEIRWISSYGHEQTFRKTSLNALLSRLRKTPHE